MVVYGAASTINTTWQRSVSSMGRLFKARLGGIPSRQQHHCMAQKSVFNRQFDSASMQDATKGVCSDASSVSTTSQRSLYPQLLFKARLEVLTAVQQIESSWPKQLDLHQQRFVRMEPDKASAESRKSTASQKS